MKMPRVTKAMLEQQLDGVRSMLAVERREVARLDDLLDRMARAIPCTRLELEQSILERTS